MDDLITTLREILGTPDFYIESSGSYSGTWDYGAMIEYMFAGVLLCIVVGSVFKFLRVLLR